MQRLSLVALAAGSVLAGAPAVAAPAVEARLPVIVASVQDANVSVRLTRGAIGHTTATANHTIVVEAIDAQGKSLGASSAFVGKRLTYASVPLTPAMQSAARLVVTVR